MTFIKARDHITVTMHIRHFSQYYNTLLYICVECVYYVTSSNVSSNRISTFGPTLLQPVVEYRLLAPGPKDISLSRSSTFLFMAALILFTL